MIYTLARMIGPSKSGMSVRCLMLKPCKLDQYSVVTAIRPHAILSVLTIDSVTKIKSPALIVQIENNV